MPGKEYLWLSHLRALSAQTGPRRPSPRGFWETSNTQARSPGLFVTRSLLNIVDIRQHLSFLLFLWFSFAVIPPSPTGLENKIIFYRNNISVVFFLPTGQPDKLEWPCPWNGLELFPGPTCAIPQRQRLRTDCAPRPGCLIFPCGSGLVPSPSHLPVPAAHQLQGIPFN